MTAPIQEVFRHENREDGAHPIKTESFGCLIPDDVGYTGRHGG
jgi:hypothetical protein